MSARTLYQTIHCEENRFPHCMSSARFHELIQTLLRRNEDECAELLLKAQPLPVMLNDGACGGILIHRDVLAAKGA